MAEVQNTESSHEELAAKIAKYEIILKNNTDRINHLENELKKKDNDLIDSRRRLLEAADEALKLKNQRLKDNEEVEVLRVKSDDTLTKAKSIIFDKTKVIKNQELQLEALNAQVTSLKDVVQITKDLLEIRNMEVEQLEIKIKCMEDKIAAEKERQDLIHQKLESMIRYNGDLKREYETQLCLFKALRERYSEKELAKGVVDELQAEAVMNNREQDLQNEPIIDAVVPAPVNAAAFVQVDATDTPSIDAAAAAVVVTANLTPVVAAPTAPVVSAAVAPVVAAAVAPIVATAVTPAVAAATAPAVSAAVAPIVAAAIGPAVAAALTAVEAATSVEAAPPVEAATAIETAVPVEPASVTSAVLTDSTVAASSLAASTEEPSKNI